MKIYWKSYECEHKGKCNEQCTEAFKIIQDELHLYQRMNLPLPTLSELQTLSKIKAKKPDEILASTMHV